MESVLFPTGFFDTPDVASLPAEYKLLLGGAATHHRMQACGVIFLTDYVLSLLAIAPATGVHLADELQRRGIAVFDKDSRAFFNREHFHWHLTGRQAGEGSRWDLAIQASVAGLPKDLDAIREEVVSAMDVAPTKKLRATPCPTNLLTSLPVPGAGKKWSCSELLVMLTTYANPLQTEGGIFVVDYDATGALCSLPPAAVEQAFVTLSACCALVFDDKTREVFIPARMKNTKMKKVADAFSAVANARSRRVRHAARQQFTRTFKQTVEEYRRKTTTYVPKDVDISVRKLNVTENSSGEGCVSTSSSPSLTKTEGFITNKKRRKICGITVCSDEEEADLRGLIEHGIDMSFFDSEEDLEKKMSELFSPAQPPFLSNFRKWVVQKERADLAAMEADFAAMEARQTTPP